MLVLLAAVLSEPPQFGLRMNDYLACLSAGMPADIGTRNQMSRSRLYRAAASHCGRQRDEAIAAAVHDRKPEQSVAEARAQAIDIIDTLDPLSSRKTH